MSKTPPNPRREARRRARGGAGEVEPGVPEIRAADAAPAFVAIAALLFALAAFAHLEAPRIAAEPPDGPHPSLRVALNHDDRAALQLLPGIGPALAERIIDARSAGPLTGGADLQARVRGIGPITAERIEPHVSFE